ncbi:hypothetical protein FNF29_03908 [Cafeteria roenbergensis]|uniref:MIF4G domain-containing protein n=1 Tax=Cafeteria roenbergensis TaxID=33653 RepID=A0A5A8CGZ8_CAFRO|nr:hypothetical protein FNF29_03908 [Cafeteria roenbergensis]|eukprot:KAA0152342.1 hypothetical protein FNF29_03908 [Cafeteria roenbergensis]
MAGSRAKLSVDAAAFVPDFIQAAAPASAVTGPLNVDAMIAIEREMLSASLRTAVVASLQEKHGATASFILGNADAAAEAAAAAAAESGRSGRGQLRGTPRRTFTRAGTSVRDSRDPREPRRGGSSSHGQEGGVVARLRANKAAGGSGDATAAPAAPKPSAAAWQPRRAADRSSPTGTATTARGVLNKLTAELFGRLSADFIAIPTKSAEHTDAIVQAILSKAADEAPFTPLYARLCAEVANAGGPAWQGAVAKTAEEAKAAAEKAGEAAAEEADGEAASGAGAAVPTFDAVADRSFRHILLTQLQTRLSDESDAAEQAKVAEAAPEDVEDLDTRRRRRRLALVRFLAELFRVSMAGPKVVVHVATSFLAGWRSFGKTSAAGDDDEDEEADEAGAAAAAAVASEGPGSDLAARALAEAEERVLLAVEVMSYAGSGLERGSPHGNIFAARILSVLRRVVRRSTISKKTRFAVDALNELREKGWVDIGRPGQAADLTIDEVRQASKIAQLAKHNPQAAAAAQAAVKAARDGYGVSDGWAVAGALPTPSATSSDAPLVPYPGEALNHDDFKAEAVATFDAWRRAGEAEYPDIVRRTRESLLRGRAAGYKCKQAALLFVRHCVHHALDDRRPREAMADLVPLCEKLCREAVKPGVVADHILRDVEVTDGLLLVLDFWGDVVVDVPLLHEYMGQLIGLGVAAGVVSLKGVQDGVQQAGGGFAAAVVAGSVSKMLEGAIRAMEAAKPGSTVAATNMLRMPLWCESREAASLLARKLEDEGLISHGSMGRR